MPNKTWKSIFFKNIAVSFLNKIQIYYFLESDGWGRDSLFLFIAEEKLWAPQPVVQKLLNFSRLCYNEIPVSGRATTGEIENNYLAKERANNSP